jgi:hypothetical protein
MYGNENENKNETKSVFLFILHSSSARRCTLTAARTWIQPVSRQVLGPSLPPTASPRLAWSWPIDPDPNPDLDLV